MGLIGPLDTVFGLPTHPLVVHAAVALLPLAALGAIAIALVPRWCRRFGVLVWPLAVLATVACVVAAESGEALAKRVGKPIEHARLGEQLKYLGAALVVLTFVLWLLDHRTDGPRPLSVKILAGVTVAVALLAIVWTVRAGDTGARAVWTPIIHA